MAAPRVASIGECMIELSQRDGMTLSLAYGGDTLNTAVYLARSAGSRIAVDYVTALGDDPYSDAMMATWESEAVGTGNVARLAGGLPGLYLIRLDDRGERRFFYYRSAAAARALFDDERTARQLKAIVGYDLVYLSAITLSILSEAARERLYASLAAARRQGRIVAFDSNYRPAGWPDLATAQAVIGRFLTVVDIALPTFDDEQRLFGDAEPAATIARYRTAGVREGAVKLGSAGALVFDAAGQRRIPIGNPVAVVDTTAAGDAFNGAFLAARLLGAAIEQAAACGHRLAGTVVQHRGAIIPRDATPGLAV